LAEKGVTLADDPFSIHWRANDDESGHWTAVVTVR